MNNGLGSEEFTDAEFEAINNTHQQYVQDLEKIANTSKSAREFLNSDLGQAIRKTIAINKGLYQERCVLAKDEVSHKEAQHQYQVWCEVGNVFGTIIKGGEVALQELEAMRID